MAMVPIGFRFNPTDGEVIQILERKVYGQQMSFHFNFIVERNLYEHEPQHLQWDCTAALPDNERYCYCMKENDSREVSGRGWWKATSHVKKVYSKNGSSVIGYKRPLTFHRFKDNQRDRNKAIKTNWIMHEFSLQPNTKDWRLCKIKYKGKPSLQEELENVRNGYKFSNDFEAGTSSTSSSTMMIMGMGTQQQPNFVSEQQQQQEQHPQSSELEQRQQQQNASYDPFLTQIVSTSYDSVDHGHQWGQSANLWSWQN